MPCVLLTSGLPWDDYNPETDGPTATVAFLGSKLANSPAHLSRRHDSQTDSKFYPIPICKRTRTLVSLVDVKALPYIAWQTIWGFPQTLAGGATFLAFARNRHFLHHGAIVTIWDYRAALSLGPFIFLGERAGRIDDRLLVHEYGHTIQSLILGPLYLPVIGLPSLTWLKTPRFANRRRMQGLSYYSFYTERWANHLGELVLKRPSMGQALID